MKKNVDIAGAGISGLATAWYLSKLNKNIRIRVWEKADTPGGLAGTFKFSEDVLVEKFYHHIFTGDKALIHLIDELGLSENLEWKPAATGSYYYSQPYRLSSPFDLLKFKPLPLFDRIRMGLMVLKARQVKNWEQLDEITARDYIIGAAGKKVYETVWAPLLKGKFGIYANEVSAAWIWSKFVDRGSSRGKGGFEMLGYLSGGLGQIFEEISKNLMAQGHEVHFDAGVERIIANETGRIDKIQVNGEIFETDLVVSAVQTPDLVKILPDQLNNFKNQLDRIKFLSNVCLVMELNRSLSSFYWSNVTDPDAPFVGIIEQTNWVDRAEYGGNHLVYISTYVPPGDHRLTMDEQTLIEYYLPHIKKMFPHFDESFINHSKIWRAPYTQPVVQTGYKNLVPDVSTPADNLYVCTMAQIYPNDRQVSNGIEKARETVQKINKSLND